MAFQKFLLNGGLVLITTITTITLSTDNSIKHDTAVNYDLSHIVPLHYNVEIRFRRFIDSKFGAVIAGKCSIAIRIYRALQSIMLHSAPTIVTKAVLIDKNENKYKPFSSPFNKEKNILTLNFDNEIVPDTYTLNITYENIIQENSASAFILELEDPTSTETDFQGILKARQLFPCWDELAIKSTFKISINHVESYTVLSNMPVKARYFEEEDNIMWTEFDKSFLMSAGHVAVAITTFMSSISFENITIWCRQSILQDILYAEKIVKEIVPYFREIYLRKELISLKLDIVALWHFQDDFSVATFGLVLLKETDITYNKEFDPIIRKREVALMVARQFAFLWCEDALLWSKEGFAIFFGTYILEQVYQNNHLMDLLVVQAQQDSLHYKTTPSITDFLAFNDTSTFEVNLEFPLNYIKSFIIWRMLYYVIIPDVFWDGMRASINMQRDSSLTTPDDFWTTMQTIHKNSLQNLTMTYSQISRKDILSNNILHLYLKKIINNWTTKKYFPVLNVIRSYTRLTLMISYDQSLNSLVNDDVDNWIPVTYITQSSPNYNNSDTLFWLTPQNSRRTFSGIDSSDWVIVNIQQIGSYRVNYDCQNWDKLMLYLNSEDYTNIHILNRAQIIDDAFYFLLQKQLSYNMFWNLTSFLLQDTNFVTWYSMIKAFESITCIFPLQYNAEIMEKMKNRIDRLLTGIGYFGKSEDFTLTTYLRQEAVKWACILGVPKCQEIAASELNKELQNSIENNNLMGKKWIYCHGLMTTNYTIWYLIWQKWTATFDERFLEYLTCFEDSTVICYHLALMFQKVQANEQSSMHVNVFFLIIAKHAGNDYVLSFIFENLESFRFSSNRRNDIIATLIVIITHVHTADHLTEITNFAMQYEEQIAKAVKEKVKKRRLEYATLTQNYENYYFSYSAKCEDSSSY